jgi:hypothetical protein
MMSINFCIVTPRSLGEVHKIFGETHRIHLQDRRDICASKLQDEAPLTGYLLLVAPFGGSVFDPESEG